MLVSKTQLQASICKDSFYEFLLYFWDVTIAEKLVGNWHMEYLCNELQKMAERVFENKPKEQDLIINVPPGSTKSTIASVMFPAWVWTRMASARIICGSHTAPLALDLSRRSRLIVMSDKYKSLFPEVELADDQQTKSYFATKANGGRMATMVGGAITGFHAHFVIIDDPLDPKKAASEADLKSANDWMKETLPTRKVDKEIAPTILIMQRLHQDDPTGSWLERTGGEGIKHICLPAEEAETIRPLILRKKYVDGLLDPKRLSPKVLHVFRGELGEYGYACQFDQSPIPRSGGMFKTHMLEIVPEYNRGNIVDCVRFWDKAGSQDSGAYTVGAKIAKMSNGRFLIMDVVRGQWSSDIREKTIKQTADRDGRKVRIGIEQEPGSGGKESAENTVRNLAGYSVMLDRPTGDKVFRADPFSVQVNIGNIDMLKAEWNADYIEELRYFPFGKYKDQVDASSGSFNMLAGKKKIIKVGR